MGQRVNVFNLQKSGQELTSTASAGLDVDDGFEEEKLKYQFFWIQDVFFENAWTSLDQFKPNRKVKTLRWCNEKRAPGCLRYIGDDILPMAVILGDYFINHEI